MGMGQTSIPVDSEVRDRLATDKPDGVSWSEFLSELHSEGEIPVDVDAGQSDADPEDIARRVAERLEGAKPLEEMAFEDWFQPDYAETIARHITAEIDSEAIESGFSSTVKEQLDTIERAAKAAEERAGSVERQLEEMSR